MTELGTVLDGKYEILKKVGQGGMSIVYLAMDTDLISSGQSRRLKMTAPKVRQLS